MNHIRALKHEAADAPSARDVETFDISGVQTRWDPVQRRLHVHHKLGSAPGEAEAHRMIPLLTAWTGSDEPIDMIVDAEGAGGASIGYRLAWNRWFYDRRGRLRVAVYHAARLDRHVIPVFAAMTGVDIRVFTDEASATAWLDEEAPPPTEAQKE